MPSLQFYSDSSPNGFKIIIALEELGLSYALYHVRIDHSKQHHPEFLCLSPHGRILVLIDRAADIALFELAAILQHLAETSGWLLPDAPRERWETLTRLTLHASSMGPILGQHVYFEIFAEERYPPTIKRYQRFSKEAFVTPDQRLTGRSWLAGEQYSIVDIATFGWTYAARTVDSDFSHYRHLDNWHRRMALRPAVQRGVVLPEPAMGPWTPCCKALRCRPLSGTLVIGTHSSRTF